MIMMMMVYILRDQESNRLGYQSLKPFNCANSRFLACQKTNGT